MAPVKTRRRTRKARPASIFERVIRRVLRELPKDLKGALSTVAISVQKRPTPAMLRRSGFPPGTVLYGIFEGLDLKNAAHGEARLQADRIILFEEGLRRDFPRTSELEREIRVTLLHELGHFFGFSEKELKARGWG